jgi:hypothetical protein
MRCECVKMPGGGFAIACGGEQRAKRCSVAGCNAPGVKLCDFHLAPDKTCDKPLCGAHAVHVRSKDLDYCSDHPEVIAALKRAGRAAA